jgi:transcriptional regulator with XRE-family HTH domain
MQTQIPSNKDSTAELIKKLRLLGLNQTEVMRRTGIPQPRLSRWENGEAPTGADDALTLKALVETLEAEQASGGQTGASAATSESAT